MDEKHITEIYERLGEMNGLLRQLIKSVERSHERIDAIDAIERDIRRIEQIQAIKLKVFNYSHIERDQICLI